MNVRSASFFSYLNQGYLDTREEVNAERLSFTGVKAWINHLPNPQHRRGDEMDWDNCVYELSNKFLMMLYDYSKRREYISNDMTFEDFVGFRFPQEE